MPAQPYRNIHERIERLLQHAPAEMRAAVPELLRAAALRTDAETLLRVSNDLLAVADSMVTPAEALRQSAAILIHALHADMYVCRLRNPAGEWVVQSADSVDGAAVPMVAPMLEEGLREHPVMRAILDARIRHLVSDNLLGLDKGGESFDCVVYKEGFRSRLAFVLRDQGQSPPFGLIMLYTRREHGFEAYSGAFLSKCARIVTLTAGRRIAVARDTLEKAAGAMAHYGNNTLNVMRHQAEYCGELVEDLDSILARAVRLSREVAAELPADSRGHALARELEETLSRAELTELAGHLGGVLEGGRRMTRLIAALRKSAHRPRLMHYALGRDVLDLRDSVDFGEAADSGSADDETEA